MNKYIKYLLLGCIIIFVYQIFWPRTYPAPPLAKRASTQYWNLPTGSRIAYTMIAAKGKKNPYPIIYLHGGPGGQISDRVIEMLTPLSNNGYNVYLYDQVGGGQSTRLANIKEYTTDRHTKDLAEIVKKTGSDKIILIGQSWGAILAVLFAKDNPEKVEKIIFTSPGPLYPVRTELANLKAPDSFHLTPPYYSNKQGNNKVHNIRTKAMAFWATTFNRKLASDEEADNFSTYRSSEVDKSTVCDTAKVVKTEAGNGYYAETMTLKSLNELQDPRPKIKNLNMPILVMKGQCDNQKWGFTNEYLELFTNHQLTVIANAGHYISVEQPALYIQTIRNFLGK